MLLFDEPAVVRRPAGVVAVSGADRLHYLHQLLSQEIEHAAVGTVADFLYLDAKGNPQAAGRAVVRADAVWLVTPEDVAGDLVAALEQFKFLLDVDAVDASEELALASVRGGRVDLAVAPAEDMTAADDGPGVVVRDRSGGVDLLGPPVWLDEQLAGLGLAEATSEDWEAWRIRAGEPAWRHEITGGRRPQELGLLPTHVHLRKGCYPGQESVAKTYNLGRPRRALVVLDVDDAVAVGDTVEAGAKQGEVTSAAEAAEGWVALAMVPLDRDGEVLGDGTVRVGSASGRVRCRVGEGLPQPGA